MEQAKLDILVNTADSAKTIRELRKALMALKAAQQDVDKSTDEGVAQFEKLNSVTNETQMKLKGLNETFKTLSGSGMERVATSTSLMREGFRDLNLEKLKIAFGALSQMPKVLAGEITKLTLVVNKLNFKSLSGSAKELGKSGIGELTKSLIQLGKAILTNPVLLLAAVIIALVALVVEFWDKIKILRIAVEAIGKAFDYVVQKLKDFADWLGITDFAAEESAKKQIENAKKTQEAIGKKYDHEIAMAEAAGRETINLERLKEIENREQIRKQLAGYDKLKKDHHILTEEQKKDILELKSAYEDSVNKTEETDAAYNQKKKDEAEKTADEMAAANKTAIRDTADLNNKLMKEGEDKDSKALKNTYNNRKKDIQDSKASEAVKAAELKALKLNLEKDLAKIHEDWANKKVQKDIDDNKVSIEVDKERLLETGKASDEQLKAIFDKEKETFDKEQALALEKDKENAALYKNEDERIAAFNARKEIAFKKLEKGQVDFKKTISDKQNSDYTAGLETDYLAAEAAYEKIADTEVEKKKKAGEKVKNLQVNLLTAQMNIELSQANLTGNAKALIIQKFESQIDGVKKKFADDDKAREKEAIRTKLELWSMYSDTISQSLGALNSLSSQNNQQELAAYNETKSAELDTLDYNTQVSMQQYEDEAASGKISQEELAKKKSDLANKTAMEEYKIKLDQYNFNKEMKHREFQRNKKMQLAQAVMDAASGVLRIAAGTVGGLLSPMGIANLVALAAASATNIAKIASTEEDSAGEPPKPPILSMPQSDSGSSSSGSSFLAPQFYHLGMGSQLQNNQPIRVYVVESDITKAQNRSSKVEVRNTQTI